MTGMVAVLMVCSLAATAAPKNRVEQEIVPLTADGQKLCDKYSEMLKGLQEEIRKAVPQVDEQKKAAYLKACEAEKAPAEELKTKQAAVDACKATAGSLAHSKEWVDKAAKAVAGAEEKLKKAATDTEKQDAQAALAKEKANAEKGAAALKKAQEAVEKAKTDEPKLISDVEPAQKALDQAKAATAKAISDLNLDSVLSKDTLDTRLVKFTVLSQATPRGLAEFAQKGKEQEALVSKLLADDVLMKQMVMADGAMGGKYGQAMEIYTAIQKASPKANEGLFQRLALAVALEHTVPVKQGNPMADTNAPAIVDPVKRYLHFEKAYQDGELDPGFKDMTVWDYRNAVNGDEPDSTLAWGREMLRNYRPDHIYTPDYRWRYVMSVKTEVQYGSQNNKYDLPTLQNYQNIIKDGGVCGRRAFFGRFILRCFGIPTIARPQPGHATLVHWTPEGWVINLGASWGHGSVNGHPDTDFLAMTQARKVEKEYLKVQRAQWVGDAAGETRAFGLDEKKGKKDNNSAMGFWNGVALYRQRQIVEESKAKALAAVGQDIGEANESKEKDVVVKVTVTDADKKITAGSDGVITIPAVACSKPTANTAKIVFMKSSGGGLQLHCNRLGGNAEPFEYTFDAPQAGKYALAARVVTVSENQNLLVTPNDAKEPVNMEMPFTVGKWEKSKPVEITLVKGQNTLKFTRNDPHRGLSIKDFTLVPVK